MLSSRHHNKADYPGLLGAFLASGIFHSVLIAILATTAIYYPPINSSSHRFDFNFIWANLLPGSESPVESAQENTISPAPETPIARTEMGATQAEEIEDVEDESALVPPLQDGKDDIVVTTINARHVRNEPAEKRKVPDVPVESQGDTAVAKAESLSPIKYSEPGLPLAEQGVGKAKPSGSEADKDLVAKMELEALKVEHEKSLRLEAEKEAALRAQAAEALQRAEAARKVELERQLREKEARERVALEQLAREKAARERLAAEHLALQKEAEAKSRRERDARLEAEREQRERSKLAQARTAEEKAAKLKGDIAKPVQPSLPKLSREPERPVVGRAIGALAPALVKSNIPDKAGTASIPTGSATAEQPPKNEKAEGIALPPINGDIKLSVHSEEDLSIKILFIDYPKGKHIKPMSRGEAKAVQKLTPILMRSSKSTLEAVLERAREGIYLFLVEPKGGRHVDAKFSLRLFNAHVKHLAGRKIAGETEVARLMMPEGVLWDDDSSFTGNIEDSDSVTKFNSDTGLVWKEYRK